MKLVTEAEAKSKRCWCDLRQMCMASACMAWCWGETTTPIQGRRKGTDQWDDFGWNPLTDPHGGGAWRDDYEFREVDRRGYCMAIVRGARR